MTQHRWDITNSGWNYRCILFKPHTRISAIVSIRKDEFIARIPTHNLVATFDDADQAKQWVEVTIRITGD
jgi:hypothetical protein